MMKDDRRVYYILRKWDDRDYIEYGCSIRFPWKVTEKWKELEILIKKEQGNKSFLRKLVYRFNLNFKAIV